jgi:hypothetical protein
MERYDFPEATRSPGSRRMVRIDDVMALRNALQSELSVAAAVARAQTVNRDGQQHSRRQDGRAR